MAQHNTAWHLVLGSGQNVKKAVPFIFSPKLCNFRKSHSDNLWKVRAGLHPNTVPLSPRNETPITITICPQEFPLLRIRKDSARLLPAAFHGPRRQDRLHLPNTKFQRRHIRKNVQPFFPGSVHHFVATPPGIFRCSRIGADIEVGQDAPYMRLSDCLDEFLNRLKYIGITAANMTGVYPMTSYNRVNGTYAHEHPHLLREILYGEWGFDGAVVSDWGGNNDRVASVKAGGTLEMPSSGGQTDRHLVWAVQAGALDEALLDEQVDRLLDLLLSTRPDSAPAPYDRDAHHQLCKKVAEKCAVLLKNEDNILPLKQQTVAVIGDFARFPRYQGAGSSKINPTRLDSGLDALNAAGVHVIGYAPGFHRGGKASTSLLQEACRLAKEAEVVLLWLGLDEGGEAEGVDRSTMSLPQNQLALLDALSRVNPNIVVILSCGCTV